MELLTRDIGLASFLTMILVLGIFYLTGRATYNLIFHPLAKFSGPLLGSAFSTNLYSFYFNVLLNGKLHRQLPNLHKQYGPVLRLSENELWFSDPTVHGDIYGRKVKLMKDPRFYQTQALGLQHSLPYTCHLNEHRHLRSLYEKYWTKSAVLDKELMIWSKVELFCKRLAERSLEGREICLHDALRKVAIDIVTEFSWNKSLRELESDVDTTTTIKLLESSGFFQIAYHFPVLARFMEWASGQLINSAEIMTWEHLIETEMRSLIDDEDSHTGINSTTLATRYKDTKAGGKGQAARKLKEEAITLIAGGSEGPSSTLVFGLFYLLKDLARLSRLLEELKTIMPLPLSQPSFDDLRRLPYFAAVMKETLRLSYGATILPRIVPKEGIFIGDTFVPGGVTVQMSNYVIHGNEDLFPQPSKFMPERFLGEDSKRLDKYLLNFSSGPAKCLGFELAQVEMSLIMAALIRRFEITPKNNLDAHENMPWVDHSLPVLEEEKLNAFVKLREE